MRLWICLLVLASSPGLCSAAWRAGAAGKSITPREPVWMSGYGNRSSPSEGTAMPLHAKALALEDESGGRFVIVTTDLIGFSRESAERIAGRIKRLHEIDRERLLLNSSHTHTGPAIEGNLLLMQPPTEELRESTKRYTEFMEDRVVSAVGAAIRALEPAELSYHVGLASFAQNRRQVRGGKVALGDNPSGPTDHTVPTLKVTNEEGELLAALFSYSSHNTTLTGQHKQFHGDYAGVAQAEFEKSHPGAVALFALSCAGDQNPRERGTIEIAEQHGRELAVAVGKAIESAGTPLTGNLDSRFKRVHIQLEKPPKKEEWERRAQELEGPEQRLAQHYVEHGDVPKNYDYPIQVAALGDQLTLVALGGEVTVDYALNLKHRLGKDSTWVWAYSNDVMSYIPTAEILAEGGYEAERSQTWYGMPGKWRPTIEQKILDTVAKEASKLRR